MLNRVLKRYCSFLLFLIMCINLLSVSAAWIENSDLAEGVIFSDDFESYTKLADTLIKNGGPYSSCGGAWPVNVNGDNVWSSLGADSNSLWWKNVNGTDDINSGVLLVETKIYAVGGYKGTLKYNNYYPSFYYRRTDKNDKNPIDFAVVGNLGTEGVIAFGTNTYYISDTNKESGVSFTVDEEHILQFLINYEENKTDIILDDRVVKTLATAPSFDVNGWFGMLTGSNTKASLFPADANGIQPAIYVDDLRIERVGEITSSVSYEAGNQIEINFSGRVKPIDDFSLNSIILKDNSGKPVSVTAYSFNSTFDKLTLILEKNFIQGMTYIISWENDTIVSAADYRVSCNTPEGAFCISLPLSEVVVLNQNFDYVDFPSNSGITNVEWMDISASTGTDNQYTDMSDWTYYQDKREYLYASSALLNGSTALCFKSSMPYSRAQSSQSIVFPFSQNVKGGTLTIEFDAEFISDYGNRFAFGLRDTTTKITKYNPWEMWGNASYLGGLTYYSGKSVKSLTMNSSDKPHMLPDGYLYYSTPSVSNNNPGSGTWGEHNTVIDNGFKISDNASTLGTASKKWKYVLDLDNERYSFYLGDVLQQTLDYIPGGSGTYDAFVASVIGPSVDKTYGNAANDMSIYLDNIKITHSFDLPELCGAKIIDYNGNSAVLADGLNNVSTGIMGVTLEFNMPMDSDSVNSQIKVTSDGDVFDYSIYTERSKVNIEFPTGLKADTTYTVSVDNVLSVNGHPVITPVEYTFTTDSGDYEISEPIIKVDGIPISSLLSIKENSTITADVVFVNTTDDIPRGGVLYLAAYKDDTLLGVKSDVVKAQNGIHKINLSANAKTDNFYGADKIRVFLFNNEIDLTPLMPSVDFPGNYAFASFNSYDENNDASEKAAVNVACLGTAAVPNVETQNERSGWRLDADSEHGAYIAVDLSNDFTEGLDTDETVKVEIDYYDDVYVTDINNSAKDIYGAFALIYQGTDGEVKGVTRQVGNSFEWKTATFILEDASFANDCNGHDFYIAVSDANLTNYKTTYKKFLGTSPHDILIGAVRVTKVQESISPYDITVYTGKPGNVFVYGTYGENMIFDISYKDPKGKYNSGTATYTVKDYNGSVKWKKTQDFSGGADNLLIPYSELPLFGVYTLEIDVSGNEISQHKIIDFSSSLKGETVLRYGTNLHYDWAAYSEQDIKDQIDLVKNSGLGMTRSKITWNDIDPEADGEYVIPSNILFANRYLDELEMENLCIIALINWKYMYEASNGKQYQWLVEQTDRDAFAKAAAWVADEEQLGKYTKYFSIGNEFNLVGPGGMHPYDKYISNHNADNYQYYVPIVKAAYPAIKTANPNAVVITGEVGRYEDEWMEECFNLGMSDYSDVVSFHVYERATGPEYYVDYIESYKIDVDGDGVIDTYRNISPWAAAQAGYKLITSKTNNTTKRGLRPWITETGLPSREDSFINNLPEIPGNNTEQAKWLPRYYALMGWEVDKLFNYAFANNNTSYFYSEDNFGMIRAHDYRTPFAAKPAYISVSAMNYFIGNDNFSPVAPYYIGSETDYRKRGYRLNYSGSKNYPDGVIMAWKGEYAESKQAYFSIPGASMLNVYDMYGNWIAKIANGSYFELKDSPIYAVKAE